MLILLLTISFTLISHDYICWKNIPLRLHFANLSENDVSLVLTKRIKPWTDRQKHWTTSLWLYPTLLSIFTQPRGMKTFVSMEGKLIKNDGASDAKKIDFEGKLNLPKATTSSDCFGSQDNT